jgi:hypothetical protein
VNVTEAYMRETRGGAEDVLAKIAEFDVEPSLNGDTPEPVHPHKTKAVAAQNAAAFRELLAG